MGNVKNIEMGKEKVKQIIINSTLTASLFLLTMWALVKVEILLMGS